LRLAATTPELGGLQRRWHNSCVLVASAFFGSLY
jgi:hypothetical protein